MSTSEWKQAMRQAMTPAFLLFAVILAAVAIPKLIPALLLVVGGGWIWVRKRGKKKAAGSLPQTPVEQWLAGSCAIWGQHFACEIPNGMDWSASWGPIHFGGRPKDAYSKQLALDGLKNGWNIVSKQDLLQAVDYMAFGPGFHKFRDPPGKAWQLCRCMQILQMSYLVDWTSREEMIHRCCAVGKQMQKCFSSWEELCESFLEAYTAFRLGNFPNREEGQEMIQQRTDIYWELRRRADSPFRLPWDLELVG